MELLVFLNYMNCCSLSVMLGRGVLIPPSCLDSFSLSYSAPELPAICYAVWKTERKIKLRRMTGRRAKKANKANPLKQFVWSNFTPMTGGSALALLCFILFLTRVIFPVISAFLSPHLCWQGLQWQRLERVIWICSNVQRCTVLQNASLLNL